MANISGGVAAAPTVSGAVAAPESSHTSIAGAVVAPSTIGRVSIAVGVATLGVVASVATATVSTP